MKRVHAFCFEGGSLDIRLEGYGAKDGSGQFVFQDDDLQWTHDGPEAVRFVNVPHSELLELRDLLNRVFPVDADEAAADGFRRRISEILGGALSGAERYTHRQDGQGYVRWGRVEADINSAFAAALPSLAHAVRGADEPEPVAWQVMAKDRADDWTSFDYEPTVDPDAYYVRPLYAHPHQSASAVPSGSALVRELPADVIDILSRCRGFEPQLDVEIASILMGHACDCREPCSDDRCPGWIAQGDKR